MLLKSNFYSFSVIEQKEAGSYLLRLHFNKLHPIFNGHFPNNPVVPGVTIVQILKEVIESLIEKNIRLEKLSLIKFLKVIDPTNQSDFSLQVVLQIEDMHIKCEAQISDDTATYFKMKSAYNIL